MSDTTIAVIVALLAGILIAAFFIGMGTSKRKKKMEIERYCKEKGYLCSYNDSGLEHDLELYTHKKMKTTPETSLEALQFIRPTLEGLATWQESTIHDALMATIAEAGRKNGAVLWPLRIALSGLASTPGGAVEIAYLLGKEETLKRLDEAIAKLQA